MYNKERLDIIMEILREYKYVTVHYLTERLYCSTATINRDLNTLSKQNLVKRTYGGVELAESDVVPLTFRYHKMRAEKNRIGKAAAALIQNGDTVFIDATTTSQYIGRYILDKKDITVITNNIALVSFLSENGIHVICLGGEVVEPPYMLGGVHTVENAYHYKVNKMFFATSGITVDGEIISDSFNMIYNTMRKNSAAAYYLADSGKIRTQIYPCKILFDLNMVDCIISDYSFSDELKSRFANTEFITV